MGGYGGAYGMMKGGAGAGKRPAPYAVKGSGNGKGGQMRPGDWSCPSCGNHNYASKTACNRCHMPNGAMGGMGMMGGMGGMQGMMGGASAQRQGDWKCFACSNINYASREQCNKCQVSKSTFIAKTGVRPGDWLCTACENHNYADKVVCKKCAAPKSNNVLGTHKMRVGDWLCPRCSNHNYADKAMCNRCQSPKA